MSTTISANATRDQSQDPFISILLSILLCIARSLEMLQRILANRAASQRPHKRIEVFLEKKMTNFLEEYFQRKMGRTRLATNGEHAEGQTTEDC
jgi:hypothetical protein